jgi:hypothetical protein
VSHPRDRRLGARNAAPKSREAVLQEGEMMGSNNYAERITTPKEEEQILADLQKVELFHLYVTERDKDYWGKGGMDIDQLECSKSTVDSQTAQGLFETSDFCYEVNFGNGYYGWCFQIHHKYVWLAPMEAVEL